MVLGCGINIKRSPLCGRNFEYFSEDPYLTGKLATGYIDGVQSLGIGTSLKHYAVNSQEITVSEKRVFRILQHRSFCQMRKSEYLQGIKIFLRHSRVTFLQRNRWKIGYLLTKQQSVAKCQM